MSLYSDRCSNGHLLTEGSSFCSICGAPAGKWTCPQGHANESDTQICSTCGASRVASASNASSSLSAKQFSTPTAEQIPVDVPQVPGLRVPTSNWMRFWAHLIDTIIVFLLTSLTFGILGLGYLIWAGWMQGVGRQSIGYMVTRQHLVSSKDGSVVGGGAGVGRMFLHLLDGLPLFAGYIVGFVTGQTFADRMVGTLVVRDKH